MKTFLFNIIVILYFIISLGALLAAVVFPFALGIDENTPVWIAWIIYPLALIVMASQDQIMNYIKSKHDGSKIN